MTLRLTELSVVPVVDEWVQKPFEPTEGFTTEWWVGMGRAPAHWLRADHDTLGEVARILVRLASGVGIAYPTRPVPPSGATEIDLLEVRMDLQQTKRGIGRAVVGLVQDRFPGPYVAISRDADSDKFWRGLDWVEHAHEEDKNPEPDEPRHRSLFAPPD